MGKSNIFGPGSIEIGPAPAPGESKARRNFVAAEKLVTQPWEGIDTVHDILLYAAKTHGTKPAFGWRDIDAIVEEEKEVTKNIGGKKVTEKKTWKYFQLSDYKYLDHIQTKDAVSEIARGLIALGIEKEHVFNVYSQTSVEWQLFAYACSSISTPIATAYDSLGEEGLAHSLNEPECIGVFTNAELLPTVLKVADKVPSLKFVVYDGQPQASLLDTFRATHTQINIMSVAELRESGKTKPVESAEGRLPKTTDVACIMYTSGSTGAPKGVVITHSNLVAAVGGVYKLLGHHFLPSDTILAYLPLAHILEYVVELSLFFVGMPIGYGRVKTLTDASVRNCKGDLAAFRPSIMVGVPAVWETIRKGIVGNVQKGSALTQRAFHGAVALKKASVPGLSQLADAVVLSKVRAATGGRLRLAMSGGAALSRDTQEFLSVALVTMLQGYGMTESCGMCCILVPEFMRYGSVGLPVPAVEIKLLDVPEAGYFATGTPPQGEVCIRGPAVIKGYYKRPDLNEDETIFTKDGWLRTGDVGEWNSDGTLSVIDRIKNLVKLSGGEYIALERLESIYKACPLVANICVHATPDAKQPMAVIIPHEANLRHALGDSHQSLAELCHEASVKDAVLKACNASGKKAGFKTMELLQAVILTPDEWTPESGLVTPAQKVQRKKIAQKFDAEIKAVYDNQ